MNTTTKPTLFGYGLTTKAIAKKLGGGCIFYDDNCKENYIDENNNTILPSSEFDPSQSSLEVTTPSLPPKHPLILKAQNLHSEYDYFANTMPFSVWISGTNGKTTTTQMLTHLLAKRGAINGGNIGTPLALLDTNASIWILESSSFTLHHTNIASPNIYLLLPITPDHLDWHETPARYEADKLKPLLTMREGELALVPKGLNLPKTSAFVVEYDSVEFLAQYFDIDTTKVDFKGAFLEDAMLSLAITKVLFDEVDYNQINSFKKDAHRQQEIIDYKGRVWINDSKATNLDATIQALKGYRDNYIRLIIGGEDKGADLTPIFELMGELNIQIYTIGKNHQKLDNLAKEYNIKSKISQTLSNAIDQIDKDYQKGDIALLSPAGASYDQFKSYIDRGENFIRLVENLKK